MGLFSGPSHDAVTAASAQEHPFSSSLVMVPQNPFVTNNGQMPPPSQYSGPFFKLSHNWPQQALPPMKNPPWLQAIGGGKINQQNAAAYVAALKQYVTPNARQLLLDYANWDADKAHWYSEPWLGSIRESIHGTYSASQFGPSIFPGTGLTQTFDTNVLTYYDERAAYTLYKVWGTKAMSPNVKTTDFQFEEGSVVVKAAMFCSDNPKVQTNWWPATNGAAMWPLYVPIPQTQPPAPPSPPSVANGYVMQFDIIVKDTVSSPKTGWVFTTLVYDANASGSDAWDKMVPLGVMWGNDPGVTTNALLETWINPSAPTYSTQTLGWGGRLSGPNDGGRNNIQVAGKQMLNEPDSSCMSCHGPSEWQPKRHAMLSFLLPSFPVPPPPSFKLCGNGSLICSPPPGSSDWSRWFQDRNGTEAQDAGANATDYDMVFAFKTLPAWWKAMGPANTATPLGLLPLRNGFNQYSGAPLSPSH